MLEPVRGGQGSLGTTTVHPFFVGPLQPALMPRPLSLELSRQRRGVLGANS